VIVLNINQIKSYLESKNTKFNDDILDTLKKLKEDAILIADEVRANEIWCLEQIYKIKKDYIDTYYKLKNKKYFDAWKTLERVDIELSFLRDNFDYSNNEYHLGFIEKTIREYEKLFPYQFFMSRETIVKKEQCTICGKINTIRNRCAHKVGKVYMGELCSRNIIEFEWIGMAIVQNPFDKYTVLFPQELEYDYFMLETTMPSLLTPYDRWYVDIIKEKNPKYNHVGRNDTCPCGSRKKYKKCCKDTEQEYTKHHRVTLIDNPNVKPIPLIWGSTWK